MKLNLNLASRPYINRPLLYSAYAAVSVVLLLLAGFNLSIGLRGYAEIRQLQERIAELRQRNASRPGASAFTREGYVQLNKRIQFANQILEQDSTRWTELFDHLEARMVDGVRIRGLQPDFKTKTVKLTGVASSVSVLRQFLGRLVEAPEFKRVYLLQQGESKTPGEGAGNVEFLISLQQGGKA